MNLTDVIPDEDFRHSMRFTRGTIANFYGSTERNQELTAQRQILIDSAPHRYAAMSDGSLPLLEEAAEIAHQAQAIHPDAFEQFCTVEDASWKSRILGAAWEPDFVLMSASADEAPRLVGGCVCFPSHWSIEEKLGMTMDEIHSPVPGLNSALRKPIDGFLERIKPGISWERANWGLAATAELNLHPALELPRLHANIDVESVWLRIELQSLVALPKSGGILFGIRLELVPLATVMADPQARAGLHRAVKTMTDSMASYKGLTDARQRLIDLLSQER